MNESVIKENLCAIVVWYNPNQEIAKNITHYANHVSNVYVIDNSDNNNKTLLEQLKLNNTHYHFTGSNQGIAAALNIGFEYAKSQNVAWVLTMDQDSIFENDSFVKYLAEINAYINEYGSHTNVGIFAVKHDFNDLDKRNVTELDRYSKKKRVMCSGNIVSYSAFCQAGGFREDFFMDWVDFEFCIRINASGYDIIECSRVLLTHFLGEKNIATNFLGVIKYFPDYPLWRKYYFARNLYRSANIHKSMRYHILWRLVQEFKRVILYDHSRNKWKKIRAMFAGVCNARKPIEFSKIKEIYK